MENLAHALIPSLSEDEKEQLKVYSQFYQEVEPSIQIEAEKILATHPFWGPILRSTPKEILEQQSKHSRELQQDAIFNNNWEPYIFNLIEQGIMYAKMGLDFRGWYEIVNLIRRLLGPSLRKLYVTDQQKVITIANGMNVLLDVALGVIGEAYIFEKKRTIQEEKEKQERLSKEIEQFVYIASHDLQEPLNTVITLTSVIKEDYESVVNEDMADLLRRISNSAFRMRNLIDDLLEYSRVGKKDEIANVSLNEIVNNVLSDLKPRIDASRASINIDSLPVMSVHPRSIALLFQNLLSNAIKFRRKEEPLQIRITAQRKNDHYQFAVSDNGIGIDPSQHNRIFGMFQRLHNYKEYEGTGIGLAHCQKIVQLHGGKIWVESNPEAGSTFYFTIPVTLSSQ